MGNADTLGGGSVIGPGCAGCVVFGEVAVLDCTEADFCEGVGEVTGDVACVCDVPFCVEAVDDETVRKDSDCEWPC